MEVFDFSKIAFRFDDNILVQDTITGRTPVQQPIFSNRNLVCPKKTIFDWMIRNIATRRTFLRKNFLLTFIVFSSTTVPGSSFRLQLQPGRTVVRANTIKVSKKSFSRRYVVLQCCEASFFLVPRSIHKVKHRSRRIHLYPPERRGSLANPQFRSLVTEVFCSGGGSEPLRSHRAP